MPIDPCFHYHPSAVDVLAGYNLHCPSADAHKILQALAGKCINPVYLRNSLPVYCKQRRAYGSKAEY